MLSVTKIKYVMSVNMSVNTYISSLPLAMNDFSTMNNFVIAIEKANIAAVNCQITTLMSFRILNKAIWIVPTSLDCSSTWPKTLNVRHNVFTLYR